LPTSTTATATEPSQVSCRVGLVGHQSSAGQDHHQRRAVAADQHNSRRCSAQPQRHYRQSAVSGCICCISLSQRLLPATTTSLLSIDPAKTLDQAFVSSRLDYCNSLLYGVSEELMRRLQSVQNAAARLVTGRSDYITLILRQLHWLPMRQRVFQYLTSQAPTDLADECQLVSDVSTCR